MAAWAVVTRDERYEVSTQGLIRNRKTGHVLKPWPRPPRGYPTVRFGHRGKSHSVHTLMLEAFAGPCPLGQEALHENDNPADNRWPENLRWGTRSENKLDSVKNGIHPNARKTHCKRNHEFTPENTRITSAGGRQCRQCVRDAKGSKPRGSQTQCHKGHEFTPENTYVNPGTGYRNCRTCLRDRKR